MTLIEAILPHPRLLFLSVLADQFDAETVLVPLPVSQPKTDAVIKHELNLKDPPLSLRPVNIENKENIIDGNLLAAPAPQHLRSVTAPILPCRLKNDVSSSRWCNTIDDLILFHSRLPSFEWFASIAKQYVFLYSSKRENRSDNSE